MEVLITGTSSGIGEAIAEKFLEEGHRVYGFDLKEASILHENYQHYLLDICDSLSYPALSPEILINNAGVQNEVLDIDVNLKGTIEITEFYAVQNEKIRAVLMLGSASAHTGSEFPSYAASKGGILSYVKNVAIRLAPRAICNSIDPGGVITPLNAPVMEDPVLWKQIMDLTPLKRWASVREIAEWAYFMTCVNRFMTGQNLLIDGGEAGNMHFIWPDKLD